MATLLEELELEAEYKNAAMADFKRVLDEKRAEGGATNTPLGNRIIEHLYDTLATNMETFIDTNVTPKRGVKPVYYKMLMWLYEVYQDTPRDLVALMCLSTLSQALNSVLTKANRDMGRLSNLARCITREILEEANLQEFMNQNTKQLNRSIAKGLKNRKNDYYRRYYAQSAMEKAAFHGTFWDIKEQTLLGAKLVEILVESTDFFALYNTVGAKGSVLTELAPTQKLLDTWRVNEDKLLLHVHRSCPMIVEPDDWIGFTKGGYHGELRRFYKLLRITQFSSSTGINSFYRTYIKKLDQLDLSGVMYAINSIQKTPWKIDKKVLAVAKEMIEKGGELAGLPRMDPLETLPPLKNPTEEELKEHKKKLIRIYKAEARRKGQAVRVLATLKTAERFADYERIYFPCNMDFRGRIYPIPSFSFQGDDLNKGLIQFADTPPIPDEKGIRWFFIAGAEFAGIDKVPFDDCVKWVEENRQNILDTAHDPMGMVSWWGSLDSPWEFLGFCFEYQEMEKYKQEHGGSAIGWTTGIPVAFDGSCSGLQHFSAILNDSVGAKEVNLKPSDRPQDIYQRVADLVCMELHKDSKEGTGDTWDAEKERTKYGTKTMAQWWLTFGVTRKVTKRSVMTLAYGSKEFGFRDQILEDTINPHKGEGLWTDDNCNQAAGYMARLIWQSVRKVVVKAVEGMAWLQKVARLICETGNVVTWTTPMGLPVQQMYLTYEVETYRMRFARTEKRFYVPRETGNINNRKQAQAIAPNFIHSMDASHLQMSVMTAAHVGVTHFSMIHDSYGTTAAQADQLFGVIRKCFVEMYENNDVLKQFTEEVKLLTEEPLPPPPEKGDFDLREIEQSLYAFH